MSYNRMLAWVVISCVLWACVALGAALGAARGAKPPLGLAVDLPPGGFSFNGRLVSAVERNDTLTLTIAVPLEEPRHLIGPGGEPAAAPPGLVVEFVDQSLFPPAKPHVELKSGAGARMFPGERHLIVGDKYIVKFGRGPGRIVPRPLKLDQGWLERFLRREGEAGGPPLRERLRDRLENQPGDGALPPPGEGPGAPSNGNGRGGTPQRPPPGRGPGNPPPGEGRDNQPPGEGQGGPPPRGEPPPPGR